MSTLSPDTQAILLLTAPLLVGRNQATDAQPLTPGEYGALAACLRTIGATPADLLDRRSGVDVPLDVVAGPRLASLLARGFLLAQAMENWQARAIWVLSRADRGYPGRLKKHLGDRAPAVLYGCGEQRLLAGGGLAVVGSRAAGEPLLDYSRAVGAQAAMAGVSIVSGGARGVDSAAMEGATNAGGVAVGVLADSLARAATQRVHRRALMDGRLVLVSPYDPTARFEVGHAMARNRLIYALADAGLVVNARAGSGGTWAGAEEQLRALHYVPVYVRETADHRGSGLDALVALGAHIWPAPVDGAALVGLVHGAAPEPASTGQVDTFPPVSPDAGGGAVSASSNPSGASSAASPSAAACTVPSNGNTADAPPAASPEESGNAPRQVLRLVYRVAFGADPTTDESRLADLAECSRAQAKDWLDALVRDGLATRDTAAACYERVGTPGAEHGREGRECGTADADSLRRLVQLAVAQANGPIGADTIATRLGVRRATAERWLSRLAAERVLERHSAPVRYTLAPGSLSLF